MDEAASLLPIESQERIQALDVVRGFALIGVFLMNVEWFCRPLHTMGSGMPLGLTGLDWWASWLIYNFVQGKFWTMFSLLFGMGFAVMLARAEQAGRSFLRPYLRRIAALAVFGIAHYVFIWGGDILFSYSVGAVALLIVLYGRWKQVLAAGVALVLLGIFPKLHAIWGVAGALAFMGLVAWYLRGEHRITFQGRRRLVFSMLFLLLGSLGVLVAAGLWFFPKVPREARIGVSVLSAMLLAIAGLSARYHEPAEERPRRLGLTLYFLPLLMAGIFGAIQWLVPEAPLPSSPGPVAAVSSASGPSTQGVDSRKAPPKTEGEKRAQREADKEKRLAEYREAVRAETHAITQGPYSEFVRLRARKRLQTAPEEAGFAMSLVGVFLLGSWLVRSGIMARPEEHPDLFRKLARYGLPFGIGLGLLGSLIATTHVPGAERDGYQLAFSLLMIGNLPACLGYLSLVVLALHSGTAFARIRVLAPVGRMALTNYLTQSVVSSVFFFGYGLGHWGMGRAAQVAFVAVVFTGQVIFSHWWLGRFQYGPMEWLWRAITYWKLPAMRLPGPAQVSDL